MSDSPIPALVVGTGFGLNFHVPALNASGFEVVGLVGTDPERTEKRAGQAGVPNAFTDLDEAIERTGAKLVAIATPPNTHAELTLKAIERGCHVLCEKPFAFDTQQAEKMLDAAEKAGIVHMVAHEFRWQTDRALFGRAIADGLIGEPRFLVLNQFIPFCADLETPLPAWWFDVDAGGGWLGAGGSHLIDQIRVWLGEFDTVSASLFVVSDREAEADDTYSMRFRMANGVEGSMQQCAGAWGPGGFDWRCAGTKGTVWVEDGKVMVADKQGTRELPVPEDLVLPADDPGGKGPPAFIFEPFKKLCGSLRDAIEGRQGNSPVPPPTFRDGVASMRILDAIRASAAEGGALQRV
jgi:predicted dehydrogenase